MVSPISLLLRTSFNTTFNVYLRHINTYLNLQCASLFSIVVKNMIKTTWEGKGLFHFTTYVHHEGQELKSGSRNEAQAVEECCILACAACSLVPQSTMAQG